jgi:predicted MFS family arabinose efflux permease
MAVLGPSLGGVAVAAGSPALALSIDAASFAAAAVLLVGVRVRPAERSDRVGFLQELRDGFGEFVGQRWLWTTVLGFGVFNFVFAAYWVLGPLVSADELGGSGPWAAIIACGGAGTVLGGLLALRLRPRRPMLACVLVTAVAPLQLVALALHPTLILLCALAVVAGAAISLHLALWFTVFQERVPEHAVSRVSSYDGLFSIVLAPLGAALAGPAASALGLSTTLWIGAGAIVVCLAALVALPDIRRMRRVGDDAPPGPPTAAPLAA